MNRCPNCNYENPPTNAFCGRCGASFARTSSPLESTHKVYDETPIPPHHLAMGQCPHSSQHKDGSPTLLPESCARITTLTSMSRPMIQCV